MSKPIMLTLNEVSATISEWSARTGLKPVTIHMRLRAGWSVVETLTTPAAVQRVEFLGQTLSIAEWAERTGLSHQLIRARLKLGWTPAAALTRPVRPRRQLKPGVVSNFGEISRTGAPSNARDFSQLEISE